METFSQLMPAFKYRGRSLIWFAAWKSHYGLYPVTPAVREAHSVDLEGFEQSKGTVHFPADERLPLDLIGRLVRTRVAEIHEGGR